MAGRMAQPDLSRQNAAECAQVADFETRSGDLRALNFDLEYLPIVVYFQIELLGPLIAAGRKLPPKPILSILPHVY
jgi:hypothetical protein